ncbi:MAG: cytidylate kinase family protein [Candidatus Bathyarchaeia archaeon]
MIAVSGLHGSGRSTHARMLAQAFNLRYVSAGQLFREFAAQKGLAVHELGESLRQDRALDEFIDRRTREEASKGGVVLDGDLSAWIAGPLADVKIFLTAPDEERFKRLSKRDHRPLETVREETLRREASDRERFRNFYGIAFEDISIYDIILNTGRLPRESVFKVLKTLVEEYLGTTRLRSVGERTRGESGGDVTDDRSRTGLRQDGREGARL